MNHTTLSVAGNLTKDPEIRIGRADGQPFAVATVAVNERTFDKKVGSWLTSNTTFYDLTCFGALGANVVASLKLGDPVVVTGRFRIKEWESDNGKGKTASITVDSIGPDLRHGTARYAKGSAEYGVDEVDRQRGWGAEHARGQSEAVLEEPPTTDEDTPPDHGDVGGGPDVSGLEGLADANGVVSDEVAEVLRRSA